MNEPEKIALIDLDGTLADFETTMREHLVTMLSPAELGRVERQLVESGDIFDDDLPWLKARMDAIKKMPGFWSTLPRLPTGMRVFRLLGDLGYKRMVLTRASRKIPTAWSEKMQWVNDNIPGTAVTVTMDKGLVYGKVLFDDYPSYIERWLQWRPRGKVLMLEAPHNHNFEHPQVMRIHRFSSFNEEPTIGEPQVEQNRQIIKFLES